MGRWDHLNPNNTPAKMIDWTDYTTIDNWNEVEDIQCTELSSIGWLLEDNPKEIILGRDYDWTRNTDNWATVIVLPKDPPTVRHGYVVELPPCEEGEDDPV